MTIQPNIPSIEDMYIDAAVRHLMVARNHLQCAVLRFDDAGYEHDPTARSSSYIAGIVAEFQGRLWRPVVAAPDVPDWIAQAAAEWRADRARRGIRL
ncbi:hypothetical protein FJ938_13130 [Mesorhizobium sp. B2-4-14]|uniref:hypothetical protein n=1 Tax=Mesorhizobium sp. B2-4-14 TaxID=2589935 RepID=UPI00112C5FE4|nr:hypothetical protein [Mesorhizobium sp. B2-4-14]TPL06416.1 hypothetical protein FJ938_13130 [Mesorhizobium sp. B2-4-14]